MRKKNNIYIIMNLLVTYGCGFLGSNFINHYFFKNDLDKLINIDPIHYCTNENNILKSIINNQKYELIKENLKDIKVIQKILEDKNITHIINFSSEYYIQDKFNNSLGNTHNNILSTHNNILSTLNLLEASKNYGKIKKFIIFSSNNVYEEIINKIDEENKTKHSKLCSTNPPLLTKEKTKLILQSYSQSFKLPIIIIIQENNICGFNKNSKKLIQLFIQQLKNNEKITISNNYSTIDTYLYSYDIFQTFEFILKKLKKGEIGEIYNIGFDEEMECSVIEIAKILINIIKNTEKYDEWITYIEDKPYKHKDYNKNNKLHNLGWEIKIKLKNILKEFIYGKYKININYLEEINSQNYNYKYFGEWIKNIDKLKIKYNSALPFEHIKIDNFLKKEYAEEIFKNFPTDFENWHKYYNPLEVKYANDDIENMNKSIKNLFYLLSTDKLIKVFSEITGITDLEYDPYLHGAGLHSHPRYGRLNMHLDYEKHIILKNKQRRLNIILFLTKDWKKEWNGDNQLWDKEMKECKVKTYPKFNSAIIFKTDEITWHGLPEKIMCPKGKYRKSFAYYYISPLIADSTENKIGNDGSGYRTKATFVKRPTDPEYPELEKLYEIRPHRRIEQEDMDKIWPDWTPELF